MQEGVLRRIASSGYAEAFILKGGLLLFSISLFKSRPTKDIDLLGKNMPGDDLHLKQTMKEILSIQIEDGLVFHTDDIELESITEGAEYQGQRLKVQCNPGNIRTVLKIDIGFGDRIYPNPVMMTYPTLLNSFGVTLLAYSLESVVAEKFEAMIVLDARNSRMKDFYDIHEILSKHHIADDSLVEAIRLTLQTRRTNLPDAPAIFTDDFRKNDRNIRMW